MREAGKKVDVGGHKGQSLRPTPKMNRDQGERQESCMGGDVQGEADAGESWEDTELLLPQPALGRAAHNREVPAAPQFPAQTESPPHQTRKKLNPHPKASGPLGWAWPALSLCVHPHPGGRGKGHGLS